MTTSSVALDGKAKVRDKHTIELVSGLHAKGTATIKHSISLPDNSSWVCSFVAKIMDSDGISDADGPGGDGIKLTLRSAKSKQELFAVNLDTFQNLENNSGNEIVLYVEGAKVAQAPSKERFNDGKEKQVEVVYSDKLGVVVVKVNQKPVVAYAFRDVTFHDLVNREPFVMVLSSFTGDAGGTHLVSDISFETTD